MTSGISSMINSRLRLSGLSSGLDTDTIIQQLMSVERMKVDKVQQQKQILEWKRDDYRSITNLLRSFKDEFFDVLKPASNFRSSSAFAAFKIESGKDTVVTAVANADAIPMTHKITVKELATQAKIEGTTGVTGPVVGSTAIKDFNLAGRQISVTLDGVTKSIELDNYADSIAFESGLEAKLGTAFGTVEIIPDNFISKLDVVMSGNAVDGYLVEIRPAVGGSTLRIGEGTNSLGTILGIVDGRQNFITGKITETDLSVLNGMKFKASYGGQVEEITLSGLSDTSTSSDLAALIQAELDKPENFGAGKIQVTGDAAKNTLSFAAAADKQVILTSASEGDALAKLGFVSGAAANPIVSTSVNIGVNEKDKAFVIKIDGTDYAIRMDQDYSSITDLAGYIGSQLTGMGVSGITVTADEEKKTLSFTGSGKITINPRESLAKLGFAATDNTSNRLSFSSGLDSIKNSFFTDLYVSNPDANVQFTINGVLIDLKKSYRNATLQDVMSAVNTSSAGVELKYDSLHDKFTMFAKAEGAAQEITITDTPAAPDLSGAVGLFKALGIDNANFTKGTDARFDLDGVTDMVRSTNQFTIDGMTYTLKSASPSEEISIGVTADVDTVFDRIKKFVEKYNEVISKINSELSEERDNDYLPLTDEQKEAMNEDDIKKWEEKAKTGLLRNDGLLSNTVISMRRALYDTITGMSQNLADIGITTGTYQEKGKLYIDEAKLKEAIKNTPDVVTNVFSRESSTEYSPDLDEAGVKRRYEENGIANRLYDILENQIRTTRDKYGRKGLLLQKAGQIGDASEYDNFLTEDIKKKESRIDTLLDKLIEKEESYYKKFAAMERALSQMNSQSAWLTQQFGGE